MANNQNQMANLVNANARLLELEQLRRELEEHQRTGGILRVQLSNVRAAQVNPRHLGPVGLPLQPQGMMANFNFGQLALAGHPPGVIVITGPLPFVRPPEVMDIDNISNASTSSNSAVDVGNNAMVVECQISEALSAKVFENDMLREMILDYVIYPNKKVSRSDLKNTRLVRKSWQRTAADVLRKFRAPMFMLTLNKENSVDGSPYVHETGAKLLDHFVHAMTNTTRPPQQTPPFSLKLMPEFFRKENYKNLSDCLISCGDGLMDLELSFPINSSMTFVFHSFYLPHLQRLTVHFSEQRLLEVSPGPVIHNNGHTIYPLQTILNSTDELKELVFKYTYSASGSENLIPSGFEYLALPETITKLYLDCPLKNSDLELLTKNGLPNLTSLRLFATGVAYPDALIFAILDKFRKTLVSLSLRGHHYNTRLRDNTLFRFPVMEKLQVITVASQCWEFEEGLTNIEKQLPKLNELRMLNMRDTMFTKWTENSKYEGVERLYVSLVNVNVSAAIPNQAESPVTLTLEKMQSVHMAFPNVVYLDMTIWGPQTCGLKYLFMEMRSLQKLAITVKGVSDHFHPSHWDALLIGVPPDMAVSFRKNPNYWSVVDLKDDNNFPSIRKLTALKSLALVEAFGQTTVAFGKAADVPLISDLSFHFAFLRMANLQHLLLHGRFLPSPTMSQRWKQEKGVEILSLRG